MNPAVFALAALFLLPLPPAMAALPSLDPGLVNTKANPLPKPQEALLVRNRYQLRGDGSVWEPDGSAPVAASELPGIMIRLSSSQRLKALIQIDVILGNSAGEKYLTPSEYEAIKKVARENWAYFNIGLRKSLKGYFSGEELERLNRDPAPMGADEEIAVDMKDPEPLPVFIPPPTPPSGAELGSMPSPKPLPRPALATGFTSSLDLPSLLPAPAAPRQVAAAPVPVPAPALPQFSIPTPIPAPASAPIPAAPPVQPAIVAASAPARLPAPIQAPAVALYHAPAPATEASILASLPPGVTVPPAVMEALMKAAKPAAPPAPPAAPAVVAPPPAAVVPPPAPKPAQVPVPAPPVERQPVPAVPDIMQAEFERWLMEAPYDRDGKALLRFISEKAPDFARARALDVVLNTMPMVVIDAARADQERHASLLTEDRPGELGFTIALNPGIILYNKKRLFFGSTTLLLPQSASAYKTLHLNPPPIEALNNEAVAQTEEQGDWGRTRTYSDGSQRIYYTHQQMAGTLLRELLLLNARRQGWDADGFAAQLYARTAQNMFYMRLVTELNDDRFLDPETRFDFHEWLEHPRDWRDELVHSLASSRGDGFDPRFAGADNAQEALRQAQTDCPASLTDEQSRREIARRQGLKATAAALREEGIIDKAQLAAATGAIDAEPTPRALDASSCSKYWQDAAAGVGLAADLLSEMRQAEAKFRQERGLNIGVPKK